LWVIDDLAVSHQYTPQRNQEQTGYRMTAQYTHKLLHWIMAIALIALLALGLYA
jgi:hypothetical protein